MNIDHIGVILSYSSLTTKLIFRSLSKYFADNQVINRMITDDLREKTTDYKDINLKNLLILCGNGQHETIVNITLNYLNKHPKTEINLIHLQYCWVGLLEQVNIMDRINMKVRTVRDLYKIPFDVFTFLHINSEKDLIKKSSKSEFLKIGVYSGYEHFSYLKQKNPNILNDFDRVWRKNQCCNNNILNFALISRNKECVKEIMKFYNGVYSVLYGEFSCPTKNKYELSEMSKLSTRLIAQPDGFKYKYNGLINNVSYLDMLEDFYNKVDTFGIGIEFFTLSTFPSNSKEVNYIIEVKKRSENESKTINIMRRYHLNDQSMRIASEKFGLNGKCRYNIPRLDYYESWYPTSMKMVHFMIEGCIFDPCQPVVKSILKKFGSEKYYHSNKEMLLEFYKTDGHCLMPGDIKPTSVCPEFYKDMTFKDTLINWCNSFEENKQVFQNEIVYYIPKKSIVSVEIINIILSMTVNGATYKKLLFTCRYFHRYLEINGDKWRARFSNHILTLLKITPHYYWHWGDLSKNPNIPWDFIKHNTHLPWDPKFVSVNPNITLDIINSNPQFPWDKNAFIRNVNEIQRHWCRVNDESIILKFKNMSLDSVLNITQSEGASGIDAILQFNKNLTWQFIIKNMDLDDFTLSLLSCNKLGKN